MDKQDYRADEVKGNDIVIIMCMLISTGLFGLLLLNWTVR